MQKISTTLIIASLLTLSALNLFAQDVTNNEKLLKFIGIETGSVFYGSEFGEVDLIRKQDQFNYPPDIYNNTSMYNWYLGAKVELRSNDYDLGILTGIRYSSLNSASGNSASDQNNDFFYFLFKEEETSVEYLRLQGIKHTANYIGIPFEIRYLMLNSDFIRLFCKASTEIHYLVSSKSNVYFLEDEMEIYKNDVINKFNKTNNLYSTLYFSGGIKLGNDEGINLNLETVFFSFMLSNNNSIINNPLAGGGFQVNIQMPF